MGKFTIHEDEIASIELPGRKNKPILGPTIFGKCKNIAKGIEVLGPAHSKNKKGEDEFSVFLKSGNRKSMNDAARSVLRMSEGVKGLRVVIDVDPA